MGDEREEIKKRRQEEVTRHICLGSAQGILEDSMAKLSQESITEANKFTENILSRENSLYMSLEKKEWHIQGTTNIFVWWKQSSKKEKEGCEWIWRC